MSDSGYRDKMRGCYQPFVKRVQLSNGRFVTVRCGCGKCINCLRNYERQWTMRLREEMAASQSSFFMTLTYNDENVPFGDNEYLLCKSDYQKFIKRVRKRLFKINSEIHLKYIVVGEYGSKTSRPHYHLAMFFNVRLDGLLFARLVEDCWKLGFVQVDFLSNNRIHYLTKYFNKVDDREHSVKYFRHMSNYIGASYLTPKIVAYHKRTKSTISHRYGKTYNLPRYYKDKIFDETDKEYLLELAEIDYRNWLRDFHRHHGSPLIPSQHYSEVNKDLLRKARIAGNYDRNDDDFFQL